MAGLRTSRGAALLANAGTLTEQATRLGKPRATVARWRSGSFLPSGESRALIAASYPAVTPGSWDQEATESTAAATIATGHVGGIEEARAHLELARKWLTEAEQSGSALAKARALDGHRRALELVRKAHEAEALTEERIASDPRFQAALDAVFTAIKGHPDAQELLGKIIANLKAVQMAPTRAAEPEAAPA